MKKVFKKSYLLQNGGCYNDQKMIKLTAPRLNDNDDIFIHEIIDAKIPLADKYYFVIKHCELKNIEIGYLVLHVAEVAMIHYSTIESRDVRVEEVMESIITNYTKPKRFKSKMVSLQEKLRDVGTVSVNDTKYIAQGLYHLIDLIEILISNEDFKYILDESYYSLKNLIKAIVSRNDLKDGLIKHLKEHTK